MRVLRNEIIRPAMNIGKITAAAARDTYFLTGLSRMINDKNRVAARAGHSAAHQPCSPRADNDNVIA